MQKDCETEAVRLFRLLTSLVKRIDVLSHYSFIQPMATIHSLISFYSITYQCIHSSIWWSPLSNTQLKQGEEETDSN